jgi:hypothetical protein
MRSYAPPPPPHGPQPHKGARLGAQRERAPAALRTAAAGASSACGACLPVRCEINNKAVTNSGQRGARGSESNDECCLLRNTRQAERSAEKGLTALRGSVR